MNARQGVLRILDSQGVLHTTLGNVGVGPSSFPTPPLSVSVDSCGNFFAAIIEHLVKQEGHRMIHKLAPEGATLATFGGYGVKPGEFLYPVAAAVAPDDSILVSRCRDAPRSAFRQ